jgi:DNA-binding MarR family transcriptional regulator
MRETGPTDRGESALLQVIFFDGPQTVPQIARRVGTSRQAIQVTVNRLQREGKFELLSNPAHKRSDVVKLTEQGKEAAAAESQRSRRWLEGLGGHATEAELSSATAIISRLNQFLGNAAERQATPPREEGITRSRRASRSKKPRLPTSDWPSPEESQDQDGLPVNLL